MILNKNKQLGFTIVELLIVIVVIAILAAISIVAYNGIQQRAKSANLSSELSQVAKALDAYKQTNGQYPAALQTAVPNASSKLTYHFNSRSNTYCIDGVDGSARFSVRGNRLTPLEDDCTHQGLALWLPLNGTIDDMSGGETVLTAVGSPATTNGVKGVANSAYAFDGSNDIMYVDTSSVPTQLERFTVSLWMKGTGGGGTDYACGVYRSADNSIGASIFWIGTNTGQNISVAANGNFTQGASGIVANTSTWRNVVLVYAGGYQTGYVDGVQRTDTNIGTITNNPDNNRISIGACRNSAYRDLTGAIDDVRIYNRALTAQEVTNLFTQGAE